MEENQKCLLPDYTPEKAKNAMRPPPPPDDSIVTASYNNQSFPSGFCAKGEKVSLILNSFNWMYAKNVVKYVEISQRKTREVLDEHLVDCETTITLDKARANKYKLPEACLRNFDESHVIRTMIKNLRRGSFSVGALIINPFDSFFTLQKKPMFLPPEFESLFNMRRINSSSLTPFHTVSMFLRNFKPHQMRAEISSLRKRHPECSKELDSLLFSIRYISYLKAFLLILYCTEEFHKKVRDAVLDKLDTFFKHMLVDYGFGMHSLEMTAEIKLLKESKVDNFSTQLSTESSYSMGCSFNLKESNTLDKIEEVKNSLTGVYLCGLNSEYGFTLVKHIL